MDLDWLDRSIVDAEEDDASSTYYYRLIHQPSDSDVWWY